MNHDDSDGRTPAARRSGLLELARTLLQIAQTAVILVRLIGGF